jgi:hypothetical protein
MANAVTGSDINDIITAMVRVFENNVMVLSVKKDADAPLVFKQAQLKTVIKIHGDGAVIFPIIIGWCSCWANHQRQRLYCGSRIIHNLNG